MTKNEFQELTGENPEDVLGGDWQNEVDKFIEKEKIWLNTLKPLA